jgi:hypothetical protein
MKTRILTIMAVLLLLIVAIPFDAPVQAVNTLLTVTGSFTNTEPITITAITATGSNYNNGNWTATYAGGGTATLAFTITNTATSGSLPVMVNVAGVVTGMTANITATQTPVASPVPTPISQGFLVVVGTPVTVTVTVIIANTAPNGMYSPIVTVQRQ